MAQDNLRIRHRRLLEADVRERVSRLGYEDEARDELMQELIDGRSVLLQVSLDGTRHVLKGAQVYLTSTGPTVIRVPGGPPATILPSRSYLAVFVGKKEVPADAVFVAEVLGARAEPAAPDDGKPPPRPRGPAQKKDWLAICAEIARRCVDKQGRVSVPKSERTLAGEMLLWCSNLNVDVSESGMREAVKAVCTALRKVQK